jgi:hypothetical protein
MQYRKFNFENSEVASRQKVRAENLILNFYLRKMRRKSADAASPYSYRSDVTGFVEAAFNDWKLTVTQATKIETTPPKINTQTSASMR